MPGNCLLEIECRIVPEKRREFRLNVAATVQRAIEGARPASIYEDQNEPGHVLFVEEWDNLQDLKTFLESDEFLSLVGAFEVLGTIRDCRIVDLSSAASARPRPVGQARDIRGWRRQAANGKPDPT